MGDEKSSLRHGFFECLLNFMENQKEDHPSHRTVGSPRLKDCHVTEILFILLFFSFPQFLIMYNFSVTQSVAERKLFSPFSSSINPSFFLHSLTWKSLITFSFSNVIFHVKRIIIFRFEIRASPINVHVVFFTFEKCCWLIWNAD